MSEQNQVAVRQQSPVRSLILKDETAVQLQNALPRYYSPEKFISILRTAINKNPKLEECDPGSFMVAMITAAQMGILPDGRHGHLIPRWNGKTQRQECTFQPDYKGKVALIRRQDNVADIYAEVVREKDVFQIKAGLHRDIIHEPDYTKPRGELVGVYAVIQYKDQTLPPSWCFMSREEVESVRSRSDSWKAHQNKGYDTPWKTDEGEMWKKTAINRLAKLADLSPDTMDRLDADPELRIETIPQNVEIRRAEVPAQPQAPALPQSTEEPEQASVDSHAKAEQEPAREITAEVVTENGTSPDGEPKKRGPGRPPKLVSKPAPNPKAAAVLAMAESHGFTKMHLVTALYEFEIAPKSWDGIADPDLSELGDENMDLLLDPENLPQVLEYLAKAKGEPK